MTEIPKKQIITIGGYPGSGKSTIATRVAKVLGYQHFSSGDLFRAAGREMGLDVNSTNQAAETLVELDHRVDDRLKRIGETETEIVIDSRTAWHWMPSSFKVFLSLDLETAAKRIIDNMDPARLESEHIPSDPKEYALQLQDRLNSEARRYKNLYDINPYDTANYDLVIDTGPLTIEAVGGLVVAQYTDWVGGELRTPQPVG